MVREGLVPFGWGGIREDVRTWWRIAGAASVAQRIRVVLVSRALWALAFYRFGRWIYDPAVRKPAPLKYLAKSLYVLVDLWVQRLTRVSIPAQVEIGADVWLGSHDTIRINPRVKIGRGARLYGANTIGLGGRPPNRGAPVLGDNVVLGPGVALVGPIRIASGVVLGANTSAARSIDSPGTYLGSPPVRWKGNPQALMPEMEAMT